MMTNMVPVWKSPLLEASRKVGYRALLITFPLTACLVASQGCSPSIEVTSVADGTDGFGAFRQLVSEEGFLLRRPNGAQVGYDGRYFSGGLSRCTAEMKWTDKARFFVYLLAKERATEFDGEIAREFKNEFFGTDFDKLAAEARRLLSEERGSIKLSPREFTQVNAWFEV